ncbi:MBL fold metallo-hydrolase [Nocardia stercoris]|uniref:MBL fold metallo-hydrolase n=1 Tax=Nocardia stercoris TaxID=2483361 RepID=A0A3M2LAG7_9NOCA|nr:MBL fold metallo-hydrolase [Nocardia stercoris]RMI34026.1 MBL fold metallo-hydrolase [Nocardia stercoris]
MPVSAPDPVLGRPTLARTLLDCCSALAATPGKLLRPRQADPEFLAALTIAELPTATATVRLRALRQAGGDVPMTIAAEGVRTLRTAPIWYGCFLVEHPTARFLVDPALCGDVRRSVLPGQPVPLRQLVEPHGAVAGLAEVLSAQGVSVDQIDFTVATHLHWDHVSGLLELPAPVELRVPAVEYDWATAGEHAPYGVVRAPLSGRTVAPVELDGPPVLTFTASHDLFGDGSVLLVALPGHTPGSLGVLLAVDDGTRVLLAGDAVWNTLQVTMIREKAPMPGKLFDADRDEAFRTIQRLHALPPGIEVIAGHDAAAAAARA